MHIFIRETDVEHNAENYEVDRTSDNGTEEFEHEGRTNDHDDGEHQIVENGAGQIVQRNVSAHGEQSSDDESVTKKDFCIQEPEGGALVNPFNGENWVSKTRGLFIKQLASPLSLITDIEHIINK